jgi:hypothetical protein
MLEKLQQYKIKNTQHITGGAQRHQIRQETQTK